MIKNLKLHMTLSLFAAFLLIGCSKENPPVVPPVDDSTEILRAEAKLTGIFNPIPTDGSGSNVSSGFNGESDTEEEWNGERILTDLDSNTVGVKIKPFATTSNELYGTIFRVQFFIKGETTPFYLGTGTHAFGNNATSPIDIDTTGFLDAFNALSVSDQAKNIEIRVYFTGAVDGQKHYAVLPGFIFVPAVNGK